MNTKYKLLVLVGILIISSCGDSVVDVTPPVMEITEYVPVPTAEIICGASENTVFSLTGGDQLSFDAIFTDNEALSQYKIDIHNNFDCHGHGGGSAPSVSNPNVDKLTIDWSVLSIQNISGMSSEILESLNVPENVTAGNYHFHVQVIDESGNDSPFANFFSLKIENPLDNIAPQITTESPASTSLVVNNGQLINFKGQVTDNRSLSDGGNGVLYLAYTDLSSGNTFTTDAIVVFDSTIGNVYNFDLDYIVPSTLVTGDYRFSLGANDGVRNVAEFVFFEVEIE